MKTFKKEPEVINNNIHVNKLTHDYLVGIDLVNRDENGNPKVWKVNFSRNNITMKWQLWAKKAFVELLDGWDSVERQTLVGRSGTIRNWYIHLLRIAVWASQNKASTPLSLWEEKDLVQLFQDAIENNIPLKVRKDGEHPLDKHFSTSIDMCSESIEYLQKNNQLIFERINAIKGISMRPVEATYLAWLNVEELNLENPQKYFETYGVGMSAGSEFGDNRYVRLNFGCQRSLLKEALDRIEKAVKDRMKNL